MSIQKQSKPNYPTAQISINLKERDDGTFLAWDDNSDFVGMGSTAAGAVAAYAQNIEMESKTR